MPDPQSLREQAAVLAACCAVEGLQAMAAPVAGLDPRGDAPLEPTLRQLTAALVAEFFPR